MYVSIYGEPGEEMLKQEKYKNLEDQMRVAGKFFGEFFRKTLTKPMGNNKDFTLLELKGM